MHIFSSYRYATSGSKILQKTFDASYSTVRSDMSKSAVEAQLHDPHSAPSEAVFAAANERSDVVRELELIERENLEKSIHQVTAYLHSYSIDKTALCRWRRINQWQKICLLLPSKRLARIWRH